MDDGDECFPYPNISYFFPERMRNRVLVYNIPANLNLVFYKLGVEYSVVNRPLACSAATYRAAWRSFLRR